MVSGHRAFARCGGGFVLQYSAVGRALLCPHQDLYSRKIEPLGREEAISRTGRRFRGVFSPQSVVRSSAALHVGHSRIEYAERELSCNLQHDLDQAFCQSRVDIHDHDHEFDSAISPGTWRVHGSILGCGHWSGHDLPGCRV